jgi:hypothetical protein
MNGFKESCLIFQESVKPDITVNESLRNSFASFTYQAEAMM